jgi:hypothetical protein
MKLTVEISRKDYADFNKFHFIKIRMKRSVFTAGLIFLFFMIYLKEDGIWIALAYSLFSVALYILLLYIALSRTGKVPKDDSSILGRREMEFGEKDISCITENSSSNHNWKLVKNFEQGKNAYYIYVDVNMVYIIPKRYFETEESRKSFEEMARLRMS